MPSPHAQRAALRRSKEPSVLPPEGMDAMPPLPNGYAWRNPVVGYDYVRTTWEAFRNAHDCRTVASVRLLDAGLYAVTLAALSASGAFHHRTAEAAFRAASDHCAGYGHLA